MGSENRGRLTVLPGGPWRLYTHPIPGWQMLGTVQLGMRIGALGLSPAGIYAQVNAGAVKALDQRKALSAIEAANRGA